MWWSPPKINPVDLVQPFFVRSRIRSRVEIREAVGTGIEPRGIYRYPKSPGNINPLAGRAKVIDVEARVACTARCSNLACDGRASYLLYSSQLTLFQPNLRAHFALMRAATLP